MNTTHPASSHATLSRHQTVFHVSGLRTGTDAAALAGKVSGLPGVAQVRCDAGTQSLSVTHEPAQASVDLILWVIADTGRRATVLHRTEHGPRRHGLAMVSVALGITVVLCHWFGVPRWLEGIVLLAALVTAGWQIAPLLGKRWAQWETRTIQ